MNQEKEQTTIRLPKQLMDELHKQAAEMGISFNALIIIFCKKGLEKLL